MGELLELIEAFLKQDIVKEMDRWAANGRDPARGSNQPPFGQPLSSSLGLSYAAEGLPHGSLCR